MPTIATRGRNGAGGGASASDGTGGLVGNGRHGHQLTSSAISVASSSGHGEVTGGRADSKFW